jgi:hypothetical protein
MKTSCNTQSRANIAAMLLAGLAAGSCMADQISFSTGSTIATGQRPGGLALVDIDGDGDRDVLFTTDAPDRLHRLINNAGVLTLGASVPLPNGAGAGDVVAADFDGDGDSDVAVAYKNFNQVQLFVNAAGVLAAGVAIATDVEPRSLIAAQLDAGGTMDMACVSRDNNTITVMRNTGTGWQTSTVATGVEPYGVAAGDMDNDGDVDLVASHHRDRAVGVYSNAGGAFSLTSTLAVNATVRPDGVALADLNADGRLDILTTTDNNGVGSVTVFRATVGGFSAFVMYPTLGANPGPIATADVDADGDRDVIVLHQDSASVGVLPNPGTGTLGAASVFATGATPDSLAVGQVVGSATPDILSSNRDGNSISLFTNLVVPVPTCDGVDFNNNGLFPEDQDLVDLLVVLAGGACSSATCNDIDFNNDGLFPSDEDLVAYLRVLAGGSC